MGKKFNLVACIHKASDCYKGVLSK